MPRRKPVIVKSSEWIGDKVQATAEDPFNPTINSPHDSIADAEITGGNAQSGDGSNALPHGDTTNPNVSDLMTSYVKDLLCELFVRESEMLQNEIGSDDESGANSVLINKVALMSLFENLVLWAQGDSNLLAEKLSIDNLTTESFFLPNRCDATHSDPSSLVQRETAHAAELTRKLQQAEETLKKERKMAALAIKQLQTQVTSCQKHLITNSQEIGSLVDSFIVEGRQYVCFKKVGAPPSELFFMAVDNPLFCQANTRPIPPNKTDELYHKINELIEKLKLQAETVGRLSGENAELKSQRDNLVQLKRHDVDLSPTSILVPQATPAESTTQNDLRTNLELNRLKESVLILQNNLVQAQREQALYRERLDRAECDDKQRTKLGLLNTGSQNRTLAQSAEPILVSRGDSWRVRNEAKILSRTTKSMTYGNSSSVVTNQTSIDDSTKDNYIRALLTRLLESSKPTDVVKFKAAACAILKVLETDPNDVDFILAASADANAAPTRVKAAISSFAGYFNT